MDGAGGLSQELLDAERSATSTEAKEINALEERNVSSEGENKESGCPSCGAPTPCSTWLKITLGFTAAKAVARSYISPPHTMSSRSDQQVPPLASPRLVSTKESGASRLLLPCHRFVILLLKFLWL